MACGSEAARRRRRSWRARCPKSCASPSTVIGGAMTCRPAISGATVMAKRALPSTNSCQPPTAARAERRGAQHLQQHLAAPGGIRSQQHAARILVQEAAERRQRLLGAQVDAPLVRRRRRESCSHAVGRVFDLEALVVDARERRQPGFELGGREVQLLRRQHRAFDVVAAFLVSLGDHACRAFHRAGDVAGRAHHGVGR